MALPRRPLYSDRRHAGRACSVTIGYSGRQGLRAELVCDDSVNE
jgi:hypothetical protein